MSGCMDAEASLALASIMHVEATGRPDVITQRQGSTKSLLKTVLTSFALRRPANPPSASDIVIDSICEYALEGYGMASDKYVDPEVSVEKDRRRRVSKAKAAAAEKDDRRKR